MVRQTVVVEGRGGERWGLEGVRNEGWEQTGEGLALMQEDTLTQERRGQCR